MIEFLALDNVETALGHWRLSTTSDFFLTVSPSRVRQKLGSLIHLFALWWRQEAISFPSTCILERQPNFR